MPRSGAWYPVIAESGAERVVLEIRGKRVAVLRRLLEIRSERPTRFTVVVRGKEEANPARGSAQDLGRTYAVCPVCGTRAALHGEPPLLVCADCGHRGEVAYWETG
jgi:hypothetical protein